MASGKQGWSPGTIIAVIFISLIALVGICCGGFWIGFGDYVVAFKQVGERQQAFQASLRQEYKGPVGVTLHRGGSEVTLLVGLPEAPAEDDVEMFQDRVWELYAESFSEGGWPIDAVAIGRHRGTEKVGGWHDHIISVDKLVERTGVAAPEVPESIEFLLQQGQVSFESGSDDDSDDSDDSDDENDENDENGENGDGAADDADAVDQAEPVPPSAPESPDEPDAPK